MGSSSIEKGLPGKYFLLMVNLDVNFFGSQVGHQHSDYFEARGGSMWVSVSLSIFMEVLIGSYTEAPLSSCTACTYILCM